MTVEGAHGLRAQEPLELVAQDAGVPEVGHVLVVPEDDHPDGHVRVLIVPTAQVVALDQDRVSVLGPLVGLMSAYHSGVLHVREVATVVLDGDGYVEWRCGVPQQVEIYAEVGRELSAQLALAGEIECEVADSIPTLRVAKSGDPRARHHDRVRGGCGHRRVVVDLGELRHDLRMQPQRAGQLRRRR